MVGACECNQNCCQYVCMESRHGSLSAIHRRPIRLQYLLYLQNVAVPTMQKPLHVPPSFAKRSKMS